jgi:hypothetical protein
VVHALLGLREGFTLGLSCGLEWMLLKKRKARPTWLHRDHPAQVTTPHEDVIASVPRLTLCFLVKVLALMCL